MTEHQDPRTLVYLILDAAGVWGVFSTLENAKVYIYKRFPEAYIYEYKLEPIHNRPYEVFYTKYDFEHGWGSEFLIMTFAVDDPHIPIPEPMIHVQEEEGDNLA